MERVSLGSISSRGFSVRRGVFLLKNTLFRRSQDDGDGSDARRSAHEEREKRFQNLFLEQKERKNKVRGACVPNSKKTKRRRRSRRRARALVLLDEEKSERKKHAVAPLPGRVGSPRAF